MSVTFYPFHPPVQNWLREVGTCQLRSHLEFWWRARGLLRMVDEMDRGQQAPHLVASAVRRFNRAQQTDLSINQIRDRTLGDGFVDVHEHNIWLIGHDVVRGWKQLIDDHNEPDEKLREGRYYGIHTIIEEGSWDVLDTGYELDGYLVYQSDFRAFRNHMQAELADGLSSARSDGDHRSCSPAPVLPERIEALYRRTTHYNTESIHDFVPSQL